jgi:ferredoxin
MRAEVFYFSGTGNSLVVARDIAGALEGKLTSIPSAMHRQQICPEAETVGFVFPIYYETCGGVPLIVRRFADKLSGLESKYIFAVCTYGSAATITLGHFAKLIASRGGRVSARFAVNMPENIYPALAATRHEQMFKTWREHVGVVCDHIRQKKVIKMHTPNSVVGGAYPILSALGHLLLVFYRRGTIRRLQRSTRSALGSYEELLPLMDESFEVSDACSSCGTCASICPAGNILMLDDRPSWRHQCEFCLACYHWCPEEAISSSALDSRKKYHHPDARLTDMIWERE